MGFDNSEYRQNEFANFIWRGVLHPTSKIEGEATRIVKHLAREIATFKRLAL